MPDIVLTTLNARYRHAAFGLRCLLANLGALADRAMVLEFDLEKTPAEMAEAILKRAPQIVGIGVYIWNAEPTRKLLAILRQVRPEVILVLGGPEVSHETFTQPVTVLADYVIAGEGEVAFRELCQRLLAGERRPTARLIQAAPPALDALAAPYPLYDARDIHERVIYVEATRGCPFKCAFCLSALERGVRSFPLAPFLAEMERLLQRGVRQFKFVDRSFNVHLTTACAILDFFYAHHVPGLFLHFEMVPDRFPEALRSSIQRFPPGSIQLEIGLQSLNPEVLARIDRPRKIAQAAANLAWLRRETGVHLHTDLIVGLPGEDLASFARGFDRLAALDPHEIQVGILKRLRGAPLQRHVEPFRMVFDPEPPYELLGNAQIDFMTLRRLKRFARYWDLIGNSGRFPTTRTCLLHEGSPFTRFMALSDWIYATSGQTHQIALPRLCDLVETGLVQALGLSAELAAVTVQADRQYLSQKKAGKSRQARHEG
ncbi:MAG: B12-binding domain-containing radical SAM protein [Magnetococcales bacterium]|nr:B12-binding domain-containing radical SAM protein [Magnetococcales bacterium]